MRRLWQHVRCFFSGCDHGPWVPLAHEDDLVQAYLRQCRRCLRMAKRTFLTPPQAPPGGR